MSDVVDEASGDAQRTDVVVPVYNEEASVDEFYARVRRLGFANRLIFVDNASTDGTVERLQRLPGVRLIRHAVNEGYGASIRDGIAASTADFVIVVDADLEYPPEAIPALIRALEEHPVVYASRFLGAVPPAMPLFRRIGNRVCSGLYNVLFGQRITDLYTGMKGLQRLALPWHRLRQNGFEFGVEMAAMVALSGERISEVPIEYTIRQRGRSKMRHIPETLKLIAYTLGYWLRHVVFGRPFDRTES